MLVGINGFKIVLHCSLAFFAYFKFIYISNQLVLSQIINHSYIKADSDLTKKLLR